MDTNFLKSLLLDPWQSKDELFEQLEKDYATHQEELDEGETTEKDFDKWRDEVRK